jgi:hypothetical protein
MEHCTSAVQTMLNALCAEEEINYQLAKSLAKSHIDARMARKGQERWQERGGGLILSVTKRSKTSHAFRLEWSVMTPVRNAKGKWVPIYQSLPRGRSDRYPTATLLKWAREWEVDMVLEMEEKAVEYRKALKAISEMRRNLKTYCGRNNHEFPKATYE